MTKFNTIDEAIIDLPIRVLNSNDLGRIDQVIAKSIKSRVLLYAASPLFNGNFEMYSDKFYDYCNLMKPGGNFEVCFSPVPITKSSGVSCCNISHIA